MWLFSKQTNLLHTYMVAAAKAKKIHTCIVPGTYLVHLKKMVAQHAKNQ